MIFSRKQVEANVYRLTRLLKEIERLEFEFRFSCIVNDVNQKEMIEEQLGSYYRTLMAEVENNGLESVFDDGEKYNVVIRK